VGLTINDIAREAGVSRSTVSLVLRNSPLVAEETRRRVRATIERLGYQPNRLAAGLRSLRSHILGLVVTDLTFPPYARLAVGIEAAVEGAGYSLIVANSHERVERERLHIANLRQYRADGLFITPVQQDTAHLVALSREGYPFVCVIREVAGLEADFCGTDGYAAMRTLVAYLCEELGHQRIAILSGTQRTSTSLTRLAGWRDELMARGQPAPDDLVVAHAADRRGGAAAAEELLRRGVAFTALVCINDLVAVGALQAFHRAGRRVPQDVSVAGIGGFREHFPPDRALTTMAEDHGEIGRQAGELLLRRLREGRRGGPERRIVPARLHIGETTGPAPAAR
jgi:LacI family transcriptional regulator